MCAIAICVIVYGLSIYDYVATMHMYCMINILYVRMFNYMHSYGIGMCGFMYVYECSFICICARLIPLSFPFTCTETVTDFIFGGLVFVDTSCTNGKTDEAVLHSWSSIVSAVSTKVSVKVSSKGSSKGSTLADRSSATS